MKRTEKILTVIMKYCLILTLGLLPIFFLPIFTDFYDSGKWVLLVVSTSITVLLWSIRGIVTGHFPYHRSASVQVFGLFSIITIASILFVSPNKIEALVTPIGLGLFVCMFLLSICTAHVLDEDSIHSLISLLIATSTLVAILAVYQFFGMGKLLFASVPFLANPSWTPAGSTIGVFGLLLLMLPISITTLISLHRDHNEIGTSLVAIAVLSILAGTTLTGITLVQNASLSLMPIPAAWSVLLESLKTPIRAAFGVGTENYLSAFTAGRPLFLNATPVWNIRFLYAASGFLHLITTLGIAGLLASIYLIKHLVDILRSEEKSMEHIGLRFSIALGMIAFLIFPANFLILTMLFLLVILFDALQNKPTIWRANTIFPQLPFIVGTLTTLGITVIWFGIGRVLAADILFFRSLEALKQDDAKSVYNLQVEAINMNPGVTKYHTVFSQTGLSVVNGILASTNQNADATLSATQRDTATRLVDQSIKEAKKAITLNPGSVLGWENLAQIYESLLGIASGDAKQWTVAAYQQAIQLDQTNPILRYLLGTVFMKTNDPTPASQYFQQALTLKPDYTLAHFGLAKSFRAQKNPVRAAMQLQYLKTLLPAASEDLNAVNAELDLVEKEMTKEEKKAYNTLLTDQQIPRSSDSQITPEQSSSLTPLP